MTLLQVLWQQEINLLRVRIQVCADIYAPRGERHLPELHRVTKMGAVEADGQRTACFAHPGQGLVDIGVDQHFRIHAVKSLLDVEG